MDRLLKKIPKSSNWQFWLLAAFIARGAMFFVQLHIAKSGTPFWGITSGDVSNYLTPIENLVNYGRYEIDYRMPGYGVFYLPLYLLFSQNTAMNILILIQLVFSTVSVYLLALTAEQLLKKNIFFYITFLLYSISYFACTYDGVILAESFTTSTLIISVYFFVRFFSNQNKITHLVLSGIFLTWCFFLRPAFVFLVPYFVLVIFMMGKKINVTNIKLAFIFSIPFIIAEGSWIIRNYIHYKEIIPISRTVYLPDPDLYDSAYLAADKFVEAWGGGIARDYRNFDFSKVPPYIYTSAFNADSLAKLHQLRLLDYKVSGTDPKRQANDIYMGHRIAVYTASIQKEKPFLYYIKSRILQMIRFFDWNRNWYLLFFISGFGPVFWAISLPLYLFAVYGGCLGMIAMLRKIVKNPLLFMMAGIAGYSIIIHPFILRFSENRYLVPTYSFMLICALYFTDIVFGLLKNFFKGRNI